MRPTPSFRSAERRSDGVDHPITEPLVESLDARGHRLAHAVVEAQASLNGAKGPQIGVAESVRYLPNLRRLAEAPHAPFERHDR